MSTGYGFEDIKISERLDYVVDKAIKSAIKDKRRKKQRLSLLKYCISAASVFVAFFICVNCIPAFAKSISNVPILSDLASVIQINYSKNIGNAINQGYSDDIHQTKMANDIKVTISNVISDNKNLYILYTLDGKENKNELKNLLLSDMQITDSKNNLIIDTMGGKNISQILTNRVIGKNGDILLPMNSYGYFCVVSSLGDTIKDYSGKQETTGLIQLTADGSNNIPEKIKLTIKGFTEAYNTSYSKTSYNSFVSEYNREPMNISTNCSFDLNINKKLNSVKPEIYSNIKFTANNTDFVIKSVGVYPTYIEAKVQLGINKSDNSQCLAIIDKIGTDTSSLPYLIDEDGVKYMPHKSHASVDTDNCQAITFESSYFNQSKELYLVVNQLTYINNISKIEPVKVKIK